VAQLSEQATFVHDGISMRLRWPDGVESTSHHISGHFVAQYLLDLHNLGDDVTILWLEWSPWISQFNDAIRPNRKWMAVK
jgi:hypothetical protein